MPIVWSPPGTQLLELAAHPGERAVEHGDAVVDRVRDVGELRVLLRGEAAGEVLLAGGEHVDAEAPLALNLGQRARAVVEADEHEHGVEAQARDRVGGHALGAAGRVDGHDGHAGGEVPHDGAEAIGLDAPHGAIVWERRGRVMEEPGDCSVCSPP